MIKEKNKDKIEKRKGTNFTLSDLVIPVLSVILLIILIIFVYMPMLREAEQIKAETETVTAQIDKLNSNIELIKGINVVEQDEVNDLFSTAIPERLEVAEVAKYVDELAIENNLTLETINASNNREIKEEMETNVWAINSPLVYKGTFNDILKFLSKIYDSSPYIISNGGFSLKVLDGEPQDRFSIWQIEITITGYYMEDASEINTYDFKVDTFEPYGISNENIEILKEKSEHVK